MQSGNDVRSDQWICFLCSCVFSAIVLVSTDLDGRGSRPQSTSSRTLQRIRQGCTERVPTGESVIVARSMEIVFQVVFQDVVIRGCHMLAVVLQPDQQEDRESRHEAQHQTEVEWIEVVVPDIEGLVRELLPDDRTRWLAAGARAIRTTAFVEIFRSVAGMQGRRVVERVRGWILADVDLDRAEDRRVVRVHVPEELQKFPWRLAVPEQ